MARQVRLPRGLASKTADQALQHFINQSHWDEQPILRHFRAIMAAAFPSTDGTIAIRDVCIPKQGRRSVGVAKQFCELVRRPLNCQVAVALHHVSRAVSYPLALRLYMPDAWLADSRRLDATGVPLRERRPQSKHQIALQLLDRLWSEGFRGCVVASEEYGDSAAFRQALSRRGLSFIVGVPSSTVVINPQRLEEHARTCAWLPAAQVWRGRRTQRHIGTFSWLSYSGREDPRTEENENWDFSSLLAEALSDGSWQFAVSNLSMSNACDHAVGRWKTLDAVDDDYRLMREQLGLAHFAGRSWRGFHHHACMVFLALGFLALERQHRLARKPAPGAERSAADD